MLQVAAGIAAFLEYGTAEKFWTEAIFYVAMVVVGAFIFRAARRRHRRYFEDSPSDSTGPQDPTTGGTE